MPPTYGQPEGTLLRSTEKPTGLLRPETEKLAELVGQALKPELDRFTAVIENRPEAERMFFLNSIRRVDQSKKYLRNYLAANVFSAVALGVFLQSKQQEHLGHLFYERRDKGESTFDDILNVDSWTDKKSANLPPTSLDRLFLRALAEKYHFKNYKPTFGHKRGFSSDGKTVAEMAKFIGDTLLELIETVDVTTVVATAYGKKSTVTKRWSELNKQLIEVKNGILPAEVFYDSLIINEYEASQNDQDDELDFTAEFVRNRAKLLEQFPPKHKNVLGTHTVIAVNPANGLREIEVGKTKKIKVIGRVFDMRADALLVEGSKSLDSHPHILLSQVDDISEDYVAEMIETAIIKGRVKYFENPIEIDVVEGYSEEDEINVGSHSLVFDSDE